MAALLRLERALTAVRAGAYRIGDGDRLRPLRRALRARPARLRARRMKVLVTGGTGFTGSHTARALLAAGHRVRLLVRDAEKLRRVYDPLGIAISDFVVGDMTDAGAVEKALAGCDGVVHSAALVDLRRA